MRGPAEHTESLWRLTVGPTIWAAHFLVSYVGVAVWCAKAGRDGSLDGLTWVLAGVTVAALAAIAATGWDGWRRHRYGASRPPHDLATSADRHRFLGFATLLLCCLSFVAVLYVAMPLLFIGNCT